MQNNSLKGYSLSSLEWKAAVKSFKIKKIFIRFPYMTVMHHILYWDCWENKTLETLLKFINHVKPKVLITIHLHKSMRKKNELSKGTYDTSMTTCKVFWYYDKKCAYKIKIFNICMALYEIRTKIDIIYVFDNTSDEIHFYFSNSSYYLLFHTSFYWYLRFKKFVLHWIHSTASTQNFENSCTERESFCTFNK